MHSLREDADLDVSTGAVQVQFPDFVMKAWRGSLLSHETTLMQSCFVHVTDLYVQTAVHRPSAAA